MRIGVSASLVQGGRSEIGRYLVPLTTALLESHPRNEYVIFVPARDVAVFEFARGCARIVPIGDDVQTGSQDLLWHHTVLPRLAEEHALDVLHVPTQRRMLWRRPCALVTTVHDVGSFRMPRDRASRGSCPGILFRALARRQDALVTLTRAAATELRTWCGRADERIQVVPVGVDTNRFRPRERDELVDAIAQRHGLHPPLFLSIAHRDQPMQNLRRIVDAFDRFKTATPSPWQLVILADSENGADEIRRSAVRSPYAPDIHCLSGASAAESPLWYRAAGGFIYAPPRQEFALPLLESMASACPIVTCAAPEWREVCDGAALYCNPHDERDVQAQLTLLANDISLRRRLAAEGLARVRPATWENTADATVEVYRRAAHRFKTVTTASATPTGSVANIP